jgi:hypothetical protein
VEIGKGTSEWDVVRQLLLTSFVAKYALSSPKKFVHVECIRPGNPYTDPPTRELEMEQILSRDITKALNHIYSKRKMMPALGYQASVNDVFYRFINEGKQIKCSTVVWTIDVAPVHFHISGNVSIGEGKEKKHAVDLKIDVRQNFPSSADADMSILEDFNRHELHEPGKFSVTFSQHTLPKRFECKWIERFHRDRYEDTQCR